MEIFDKIQEFLTGTADIFGVGAEWSPAVFVALIASVIVLVAFFVALGIRSSSKGNKFRKHLEDTAAYIEKTGEIDVDNVDGLNSYIQDEKMARSVKKGWGTFLEQQTGYPSDYISEGETFGDRKTNPDYKGGTGFFKTVSAIVLILAAALAAIGYIDAVKGKSLSAGAGLLAAFEIVLPAVIAIAVPLLIFVIARAVLAGACSSLYKKAKAAFAEFCDALDNNVIIFREPEDEFISENIEEINAAIDDIIAGKLGDAEILEIVTAPAIDEDKVVEEAPEPEPVAEPVREEAAADVAPEPEPEPEVDPNEESIRIARQQALLQIVVLSDRATRDPNVGEQDLIDLAVYLDTTMENGDFTPEERELFMRCYFILQARYFEMIGRPDLIQPID